jgi:ribose transport system ATP-binding protein
MTDAVIELHGIVKDFPGVRALDHVDFSLRKGEVHALLGENGAGKSTLIKILTGVYSRGGGEILINGVRAEISSPAAARGYGIDAIYQEQYLCPDLTVEENLFANRLPRRKSFGTVWWSRLHREAEELLRGWKVDFGPRDRVGDLDVSQRQIIEIIKAVSKSRLAVLILDEPTAALNDEETRRLFGIVGQLRERGISIIYISHRLNEVFEISNSVTVLRDGKNVGTRAVAETTKSELIKLMIGRDLAEMFPKRAIDKGEVVLRVDGLRRGNEVRDMSLSLRAGEILGLYGLLGSGTVEVGRCLFGILQPDAGELLLGGKAASIRSVPDAVKAGIGFVPEDRKVDGIIDLLSVRQNLTLANIGTLGRLGFLDRNVESERSGRWVKRLSIKTPSLETATASLSGGNQQKVVIGKWLDSDSRILILNEPTHGVDVGAKVEIYAIVEDICENGAAVLMISSEIPELTALCDRVIVMYRGRTAGELSGGDITQENILSLAMRGER